jgi:O-antigen/teichoic acid export membrane protein
MSKNLSGHTGEGGRLALLRKPGARQGLVMGISMVLAGGLDYAVNVVAGRWLGPVDFGVFVSITALLQVLLALSIAIRLVVALHTAELSVPGLPPARAGAFVRRAWLWSWRWGLAGTALVVLVSPLLAGPLQIPDAWPLWAASPMVAMLFVREAGYGTLQGIQSFTRLGGVQVVQSALRLLFAVALVWLGWRATGAILAQPLAGLAGVALMAWWLRPQLRERERSDERVSWRYSVSTLLGLSVFGVLTNLDALFVKRFYDPAVAGHYGPVVTLERISLFLPWAVGFVLFPKVAARRAEGRDPRPVLLLSLAASLVPGLGVSAVCFLFPGPLVRAIFTSAYADPGVVLGLVTLAATFYAGIHIWLNYALSLKRHAFIYVLASVLLLQGAGMYLLGRGVLVRMALVMAASGALGNLAGFASTWFRVPAPAAAAAGVVERPGES